MEIVEALRRLWDDVAGGTIDPEQLVDLALSRAGPNHEFDDVIGMSRLADGSLVLVNRGWSEIRLYSAEGGFLNSTGRFWTTGERLDSIGAVEGVENYLAYGGRLSLWPLFGKASQVATGGGRIFRRESDEL